MPRTVRYDALVIKYAEKYNLDPRLIKSVIATESSFRSRVRSSKGATGLMQLMPLTAEEMGVPRRMLTNPEHNIRAGAAYLAHLFKRIFKTYGYGDSDYRNAPKWMIGRVLAAYNAGPRFLYKKRWYRVTRRYVSKVLKFYGSRMTEIKEQVVAVLTPKQTIPLLLPGPNRAPLRPLLAGQRLRPRSYLRPPPMRRRLKPGS